MAEIKTKKTTVSVTQFLGSIEDDQKRKDSKAIAKLMREATGARAVMWGASVVGFGSYRYLDGSGKEQDWFQVGFSPRKQALTLYVLYDLKGIAGLMKKLGPHKTGRSCLYIKRLSDIDMDVLRELVDRSVERKRRLGL